jgi:hypothetical protein
VLALRKKFKELYSKRKDTGHPTCPADVRFAKRLAAEIENAREAAGLYDNEEEDSQEPQPGDEVQTDVLNDQHENSAEEVVISDQRLGHGGSGSGQNSDDDVEVVSARQSMSNPQTSRGSLESTRRNQLPSAPLVQSVTGIASALHPSRTNTIAASSSASRSTTPGRTWMPAADVEHALVDALGPRRAEESALQRILISDKQYWQNRCQNSEAQLHKQIVDKDQEWQKVMREKEEAWQLR